jgi:hypothetical protein
MATRDFKTLEPTIKYHATDLTNVVEGSHYLILMFYDRVPG